MSLFGKTAAGGWRKPSYAALAFIAVMAISAAIFIAIMGQSDDSSLTHIDMVHIFISAILFIAAAILVSIHIIKSQHFGGAALSAAPASSAAMQDGLTGCLQRKAIYSHLRQAISEAQKNKLSMAMVYISIDNLQKINNHFGHVQGDQIIKKTADIIKENCPLQSHLFRMGGGEFCFFYHAKSHNGVSPEKLAAIIIEKTARHFTQNSLTRLHITLSIGVTQADHSRAEANNLLRQADLACQQAKERGRNQICTFDETLENRIHNHSVIEHDFLKAMDRNEFTPHYAQQIDVSTGKLVGFEAIAHWVSPSMGLVTPDIFMPIARMTKKIQHLSENIMTHALADTHNWKNEIRLTVNADAEQFKDPWFAQKLLKHMTQSGFLPHMLELDVTEDALIQHQQLTLSMLSGLQNQGVHICLDNFGTGYSSLSHLHAFSFDKVKISAELISDMLENQNHHIAVKSIFALCNTISLPVMALGVNDKNTHMALKEMGCHYAQGDYYGKAKTIMQVRRLLAESDMLKIQGQQNTQVA